MFVVKVCIWDHIKKRKALSPSTAITKCKTFTLHSNSGCRRSEKIHTFIADMICYISVLSYPLPEKPKENYNLLICILCSLGIM